MPAKAKLTIVLKANETVVAESEDAALWQRVLGIINGVEAKGLDKNLDGGGGEDESNFSGEEGVERFAKRLGLSAANVEGAMSPSREAPYITLNSHNWEAFKKNFPKRGPGAVNPIALAGTLLALWLRDAKIEVTASQSLAAAVLDTIGVKDPNPSRGIKNTKWLQTRAGGTIIINPAEISKAQEILKLFCLKKPPVGES